VPETDAKLQTQISRPNLLVAEQLFRRSLQSYLTVLFLAAYPSELATGEIIGACRGCSRARTACKNPLREKLKERKDQNRWRTPWSAG